MTLSLNEVDALAKKATRGAGYSWGLAEEAGKATRWLCAYGLDGCGELAELLERFDGVALVSTFPTIDGAWHAPGGTLCPLATGAALSDHAGALLDGEIRVASIANPGLLLPFAANAAQSLERAVCVEWAEGSATIDGAGLRISGQLPATTAQVVVRQGGVLGPPAPKNQRADPDAAKWAVLERFAHRTYAPATEDSRRKGAGADTTDND